MRSTRPASGSRSGDVELDATAMHRVELERPGALAGPGDAWRGVLGPIASSVSARRGSYGRAGRGCARSAVATGTGSSWCARERARTSRTRGDRRAAGARAATRRGGARRAPCPLPVRRRSSPSRGGCSMRPAARATGQICSPPPARLGGRDRPRRGHRRPCPSALSSGGVRGGRRRTAALRGRRIRPRRVVRDDRARAAIPERGPGRVPARAGRGRAAGDLYAQQAPVPGGERVSRARVPPRGVRRATWERVSRTWSSLLQHNWLPRRLSPTLARDDSGRRPAEPIREAHRDRARAASCTRCPLRTSGAASRAARGGGGGRSTKRMSSPGGSWRRADRRRMARGVPGRPGDGRGHGIATTRRQSRELSDVYGSVWWRMTAPAAPARRSCEAPSG